MAAKKKTTTKPSTKRKAGKKAPVAKRAKATLTVGTTIERTFKGTKHTVQVTASGFAYKDTEYRSLTALAKKITGYPAVSGPRFFATDAASQKGGQK